MTKGYMAMEELKSLHPYVHIADVVEQTAFVCMFEGSMNRRADGNNLRFVRPYHRFGEQNALSSGDVSWNNRL